MNNDQHIAEQLDHLEQEIALLTDSAKSLRELRDDLAPRINEAVKLLIAELAQIEADFQLEDVLDLVKNLMRNIRNLNWSVDQLKNLIDFLRTVEPLLKSTVPQAIVYLDGLERKGVFQIGAIMLGAVQKIAEIYTPEDIQQIADGMVHLVGIAKKLTAPEPLELLSGLADVPAQVDLARARPVGPIGMLFALRNPEVKQGMGVALELTKGLGAIKGGSSSAMLKADPTHHDGNGASEDEDRQKTSYISPGPIAANRE